MIWPCRNLLPPCDPLRLLQPLLPLDAAGGSGTCRGLWHLRWPLPGMLLPPLPAGLCCYPLREAFPSHPVTPLLLLHFSSWPNHYEVLEDSRSSSLEWDPFPGREAFHWFWFSPYLHSLWTSQTLSTCRLNAQMGDMSEPLLPSRGDTLWSLPPPISSWAPGLGTAVMPAD